MDRCLTCNQGTLRKELVETWMRKGERWVLVRNVEAMVCDICGEKTFSQKVAERLASIVEPTSSEIPTDFLYVPVFDLIAIDKARAEGKRPVSITEVTAISTSTKVIPSILQRADSKAESYSQKAG